MRRVHIHCTRANRTPTTSRRPHNHAHTDPPIPKATATTHCTHCKHRHCLSDPSPAFLSVRNLRAFSSLGRKISVFPAGANLLTFQDVLYIGDTKVGNMAVKKIAVNSTQTTKWLRRSIFRQKHVLMWISHTITIFIPERNFFLAQKPTKWRLPPHLPFQK